MSVTPGMRGIAVPASNSAAGYSLGLGRFDISASASMGGGRRHLPGDATPPAPPPSGGGSGNGGDGDDWKANLRRRLVTAARGTTREVEQHTVDRIATMVSDLDPKLREASLSGMIRTFRKFANKTEAWTNAWDWLEWSVNYYREATNCLNTFLGYVDPDISSALQLRSNVIDALSKVRLNSQVKERRIRSHRRDVGRMIWKLLDEDDLEYVNIVAYFKHMYEVPEETWTEIAAAYTPSGIDTAPESVRSLAIELRDRQLRSKAEETIDKARTYFSPSKAIAFVTEHSTRGQLAVLASLMDRGHDVEKYVARIAERIEGYYQSEMKKDPPGTTLPDDVRDELLLHLALKFVKNRTSPTQWGRVVYGRMRYLMQANELLGLIMTEKFGESADGIREQVLLALFEQEIQYGRLRGRVYTIYKQLTG